MDLSLCRNGCPHFDGLIFGRNILFHLGQDPEVVRFALPFLYLMGWSIIPMLLFMTLKQFTDGLEFTRTAMLLSLAGMPVNIFLNWLLIYGNWASKTGIIRRRMGYPHHQDLTICRAGACHSQA